MVRRLSLGILSALATALVAQPSLAQTPRFQDVSQSEFESLVRDFSADSVFTTVSPASSLGRLWGFEVGLMGGAARVPNVNTLAKRTDSNLNVPVLPHAGLIGALTVPLGITAELTYMPKTTVSGVSYGNYGVGAKWTFTDELILLPFSMAIRGYYTQTSVSFNQRIQNSTTSNQPVDVTVDLADSLYGAQFLLSKDFVLIEPYIGLGWVRSKGTAGVSGSSTASIFAPSFTSAQSADATVTSTQLLAGFNLKLAFFRLGAEYSRLYDTDRYTAKLSFAF